MTRPTLLAILLLAAAVAALYAYRLSDSPIYLTPDEVVIGLDAHALATTGADLRGRTLPLYFQINEFQVKGTIWYQPAIMYLTAAVLTIAPLTEWAIRSPAVLIGVIDVILMFLLVRRLAPGSAPAWLAAILLALSPAHFTHSRFAMDYIYPLPFILGWLCALAVYLERRRPAALAIAGLCLGFGFYSYIAAIVLMPAFFVVTMIVLWHEGRLVDWKYAVAGFAAPLSLFVLWIATHLGVFAETFARYEFGNSNRVGLLDRFGLYWRYFSPSFLFFNGGSQLVFSTRVAGVFPIVSLMLLPAGLIAVLRRPSSMGMLAVVGLLAAPLPAILLDEGSAINRALELVPFGIVLSVIGFNGLSQARPAMRAPAAIALIAVTAWQFAIFGNDYFGDYRRRAASWFQFNIRGGLAAIVEHTGGAVRPVYLNDAIRWVDSYWKFHLAAVDREDLLASTRGFTHLDRDVPTGSLLLVNFTDPAMAAETGAAIRAGDFHLVREITEPDGTVSFVVLER
ncbi:MAG TPA: glycosyltransferase family 39 protein [Vicinamibacterales bacterium]|jgi:4-amino-4-deoxy-L-arabinose transferase-like glycosyltransferase